MHRAPLLLFLWLSWAAVPAWSEAPPAVVTVYFTDRPPYAEVDGQTGTLLEVVKAVMAEAGVRGRFIELPPNRILELLKAGAPDALGVGWLRTPERELWGRFSPAIYQDRSLVIVANQRAAAQLGTMVRLDTVWASGLTLARQSGISFGVPLDQRIRAAGLVPLETVVDVAGMLKLIAGGRMDYTFLAEEEARYLLDQDPNLAASLVLVKIADPPPPNLRCLLYSASMEPPLADRLDAAVEKVKASARYRLLISGN